MNQPIYIYSDFDGTITQQDSLKLLLDHFADPRWRKLERAVKENACAERLAIQEMMKCMSGSYSDALAYILENVSLDPSFSSFASFCQASGGQFRLAVLSGGFRSFIHALFEKEGIVGLPIQANEVLVAGGHWRVQPQMKDRLCVGQSQCKCSSIMNDGFKVYVGDGHTDRCPVSRVDLIFAKDFLAEYCEQEGLAYIPLDDFDQVREVLEQIVVAESIDECLDLRLRRPSRSSRAVSSA